MADGEHLLSAGAPTGNWFSRHSTTLLIFAVLIVLILLQWPAVKNMLANALGLPLPEDHIAWRTDYAAALEESRSSGKPVLIDFSAPWCPTCQVMKREVWPDAEVSQLIESNYIPLLQDVERPGSQTAAQRYDIYALPDILIVDANGSVLRRATGFSRSAMLRFLQAAK